MLITLSLRYAWRKKSRSLIIVTATLLSSFLFCAILMMSSGMIDTIQADARHRYGDFTIGMAYADKEEQKDFILQCENDEIVTKNFEGYIAISDAVFSVWSVSNEWYDCFDCKLSEGNYPSKANEVLIPDNSPVSDCLKIGDTICAELFIRMDADGEMLDERVSFSDSDIKKTLSNASYEIVGKYANDGRSAISSNFTICLYLFENPNQTDFSYIFSKSFNQTLWESLEKQYSDSVFFNKNYLDTLGYSSTGESVLGGVIFLCSILLALIAFAIFILIFNAFSLSYREQSREFGVLSSLGATSSQIKLLFILEAFWLSICGSVFGILLSVGCFVLGISQIAPPFLAAFYVTTEFVMPSFVTPVCLSVACTVMISLLSALLPALFSANSSQIDLMRESRISHSTRFDSVRFHQVELFLAERYRRSNGFRFWIMVSSLGVTTIIFLLSVGICNAEIESNEKAIISRPYDISFAVSSSSANEISSLYDQLLVENTVDKERSYCYLSLPSFLDNMLSGIMEGEINVIAVPETKFQKIVDSKELPDIIVSKNTINFLIDGDTVRQENVSLFSEYSTKACFHNMKAITAGCVPWQDLCDIFPCFLDVEGSLVVVPDNSAIIAHQPIVSGHIFIFAADHKTICDTYQTDSRLSIHDLAANYDHEKTDLLITKYFLYVFMFYIFLVCFINMFFTVFSNYKLREKDYLVLQTLGMIPK